MTPENWKRLRKHFESLCELDRESRQAAIDALDETPDLKQQLHRMLHADTGNRLQEVVSDQVPSLHRLAGSNDTAIPNRNGERFGPWRITGILGAGGMGQVYRAHRDDGRFEAEAAIKIVTRAVNAAQFVHERAVLARLQHPNIARLLDGGESRDGRPYLVMELVDGKPIDQHCRQQGCDINQVITLMLGAARGVAYAHARAVLHRDIKPDNIMVDDAGQVKLLDFGVAKLLDVEHDGRMTVAACFTPRYAAPEQVAGEQATTASDVFSLAVVLYELVSGRHPFASEESELDLTRRILTGDATPLRRAMRETQHVRPASALPLRDLEFVLAHALHSDPTRRFQDVNAFVEELLRISEDRPILTRQPAVLERTWRWALHNRVAASAILVAALSLLIGSAIALTQAHEANLQRDAAIIEARRAERVAAFLSDVFKAPDPSRSQGNAVSARELLDRSRERINTELADDPLLRQRLQAVMADTYRSLGLLDEAESLLLNALEQAGAEPSADLLITLGWVHAFQGRFEDSVTRLREAADRAATTHDVAARIDALSRLATPLLNLGDPDGAEKVIHQSMALSEASGVENRQRTLAMMGMLANIAFTRGDLDTAEAQYQKTLDLHIAEHGENHTDVAMACSNLATVAYRRGDWKKAELLYRRALASNRAYFGVENAQMAAQTRNLALTLRRSGQFDASLENFRLAADMSLKWTGEAHPATTSIRLEALETALLMGEQAPRELAELDPIIQSIDVDTLPACRFDGLRQWWSALPSLVTIENSRDCLDRLRAPEANRAMAEIAVARAQDAINAPSAEAWQRARSSVESMELPDPLLLAEIKKHSLSTLR